MDGKNSDLKFQVYPVQPKPYKIEIDPITKALIEYNNDLKHLLRLAVDDFDKLANVGSCYYPFCGESCPFDCIGGCEEREWKHRDEAMKLLGGTENAEYRTA